MKNHNHTFNAKKSLFPMKKSQSIWNKRQGERIELKKALSECFFLLFLKSKLGNLQQLKSSIECDISGRSVDVEEIRRRAYHAGCTGESRHSLFLRSESWPVSKAKHQERHWDIFHRSQRVTYVERVVDSDIHKMPLLPVCFNFQPRTLSLVNGKSIWYKQLKIIIY